MKQAKQNLGLVFGLFWVNKASEKLGNLPTTQTTNPREPSLKRQCGHILIFYFGMNLNFTIFLKLDLF